MIGWNIKTVYPDVATITYRRGLDDEEIDRLEEECRKVIEDARTSRHMEMTNENTLLNLHANHDCNPGPCRCKCGCKNELGCRYFFEVCSDCYMEAVRRGNPDHDIIPEVAGEET